MMDITQRVSASSPPGSPDVRIVQQLLNRAGTLTTAQRPLRVDGNIGPMTLAAVRDFQRRYLKSVDEIIEPGTEMVRTLNAIADEFQIVMATVYGEAAASSDIAKKAVLCVIRNRVGQREWAALTTMRQVISGSGFDAYTQKNAPYMKAFTYMSSRCADAMNPSLERVLRLLEPLYHGVERDITSQAVLYYSPNAQGALHKRNPNMYADKPKWNFKVLQEVSVRGLQATDDFKFYRYK